MIKTGFAAGAIALALMTTPSRADILYHYAQITCLPDAQQFAVRTFEQYNSPRPPGHGIVTAGELVDPPYHCDLPAIDRRTPGVSIEVKGHTEPPGDGYCQGDGYEGITISANGQEIANIDMTLCPDFQNTITMIQGNGVFYETLHCSIMFGDHLDLGGSMKGAKCTGGKIENK